MYLKEREPNLILPGEQFLGSNTATSRYKNRRKKRIKEKKMQFSIRRN